MVVINANPKNWTPEKFFTPKKLIRIAPPRSSVMSNFEELKIGTVFEFHVYEIFKISLNEIRNSFKNPNIDIQKRHTKNENQNIQNFSGQNDGLESRAILLMNTLRKWGV